MQVVHGEVIQPHGSDGRGACRRAYAVDDVEQRRIAGGLEVTQVGKHLAWPDTSTPDGAWDRRAKIKVFNLTEEPIDDALEKCAGNRPMNWPCSGAICMWDNSCCMVCSRSLRITSLSRSE